MTGVETIGKRDRTIADQLRPHIFCIFCLIRMDTDRCGRLFRRSWIGSAV